MTLNVHGSMLVDIDSTDALSYDLFSYQYKKKNLFILMNYSALMTHDALRLFRSLEISFESMKFQIAFGRFKIPHYNFGLSKCLCQHITVEDRRLAMRRQLEMRSLYVYPLIIL